MNKTSGPTRRRSEFAYATIPDFVLLHGKLEQGAKLLYGLLSLYAIREGFAWASNAHLAGRFGVHDSTVKRWLRSLQDEGLIEVEHDPGATYPRRVYIVDWSKAGRSEGCKNAPGGGAKMRRGGGAKMDPYVYEGDETENNPAGANALRSEPEGEKVETDAATPTLPALDAADAEPLEDEQPPEEWRAAAPRRAPAAPKPPRAAAVIIAHQDDDEPQEPKRPDFARIGQAAALAELKKAKPQHRLYVATLVLLALFPGPPPEKIIGRVGKLRGMVAARSHSGASGAIIHADADAMLVASFYQMAQRDDFATTGNARVDARRPNRVLDFLTTVAAKPTHVRTATVAASHHYDEAAADLAAAFDAL